MERQGEKERAYMRASAERWSFALWREAAICRTVGNFSISEMRKRMSGKRSSASLHHGGSGRRWSLIGEINNSSGTVMKRCVLHLVTSAVNAPLKINPIYHALAALEPSVRGLRSDALHFIIWDKLEDGNLQVSRHDSLILHSRTLVPSMHFGMNKSCTLPL